MNIINKLCTSFKKDAKSIGLYWREFTVCFVYWEFMLKLVTGADSRGSLLYFLCFVPAEGLFLSLLNGWLKEKLNRIFTPVIIGIVNIYYLVQTGYYKVFGSMFSVSFVGMGNDAVSDFGWTMTAILEDAAGTLLLMLLPLAVSIVLAVFKKTETGTYSVVNHIVVLAAVIVLWLLGSLCLRIGGTDRQSPYYAYTNSLSDTDTTSDKIGASATTVIELGAYLFGIGGGQSGEVLQQSTQDVALVSTGTNITLGGSGAESGDYDGNDALWESDDNADMPGKDTGTSIDDSVPDTGVIGDTAGVLTPVITKKQRKQIVPEIDFETLASLTQDKGTIELCNYFAGVEGTMKNAHTGKFKGYNLVYICAESFWSYAIDEKATPTLYKMANNGIVLKNYYNSFKNTTTNGEFAMLTSLWPDVSRDAMMGTDVGSFPQSASKYMPYGLGNIFKNNGWGGYGYHNFKGSYYKRSSSLPNLGFDCKFMGSGMTFTTSWPASDLEMLEQSVDDYINDECFAAYYMTFSGHGPYDTSNLIVARNLEAVRSLTEGSGYSEQALGYLAANRELDKAMEYLLNRLEEAGKLDNTLIVITGDHYPYYVTQATRKSLAGYNMDTTFEMYKSSCIMYNAGMKEPENVETYCCNVDILPTVLNLLGITYDSRMIAGTDIFSNSLHKATLYNKSFITDIVKYDAATGKAEWLVDVSDYTKGEKQAYIDAVSNKINVEYAASLNVMDKDFYRFVWEKSGLMDE